MPIYMDRHDAPDEVTPDKVALMHASDAKIEHRFNVRVLTYWFDNTRKSAFCLVDAPNKKAIQAMHNKAHGDVPHLIIKVNPDIVASFLGRIEDPPATIATEAPIDESAFRTIMVIDLDRVSLKKSASVPLTLSLQKYSKFIAKTIQQFQGRIVNQNLENYMVSFGSASKGVKCALKIRSKFEDFIKQPKTAGIDLKISLSGDSPVTKEKSIFESAIKLARRMCYIDKASILLSSEVNELYISESLKVIDNSSLLYPLSEDDEKFLTQLMEKVEATWTDTTLNVEDYNNQLGLSKSQLYRRITALIGKSPNNFLKEYRLSNALKMLNKQKGNISEIAFDTGFNSPSYFSKCFLKKFGVSPSDYLLLTKA